jgi:hypothetical protein
MCNCIDETKKSLEQRYNSKEGIDKVTKVSLGNTALMFGEGPSQVELYSPAIIEYDYKNKKGETKHKKEKVNLCYRYCPFCGKPYTESEE